MSKADGVTAPTDEQVKQSNEVQEAKWQGDFKEEDLKIPYKREAANDDKAAPAALSDDTSGSSGAEDGKEPSTNGDDSPEPEVYSEPAAVITVEDPGDYKPADYSFEVTLANGKSVKISNPEDAEKLADDPENFQTPKQLLQFIRQSQKMENSLDKDKDKYNAQKEKFDEQSKEQQTRDDTVDTFESEFLYLAGKGLIPKLSSALMAADWADPDVAQDKDVKVYAGIMDYLVKENAIRAKAGVRPMTSILDAFSGWQLDNERRSEAEAKTAAGEARKAAGSRVAGVSATQQSPFVPKGIAVGNPNILKRGQVEWDD